MTFLQSPAGAPRARRQHVATISLSRVLPILLVLLATAPRLSAHVWRVVDQQGLAAAVEGSIEGDTIELVAGAQPYRGPVILKSRQTLAGSGQPVIEARTDAALIVNGPDVSVDGVVIDVMGPGDGVSLRGISGAFAFRGGMISGAGPGAAVRISGGAGEVTFTGVTIDRTTGPAAVIRGRTGGTVAFRDGSVITVNGAKADAISIEETAGTVSFASEVRIATRGARALYVKNSGALVMTAPGSVLSSIDAPVIEIRSAAVDVTLSAASVSRTQSVHLDTGLILQRVTGRFRVSGGTISGAKMRGIDIAHATNISLVGLVLGNNVEIDGGPGRCIGEDLLKCNAAMVFEDVDGLVVENVRIERSGQYGISGLDVRNAVFRNVSISEAGDEVDEHAMHFRNLGGTVRLADCTVKRPASRALYIENAKGEAEVVLENIAFSGSVAPNGGQAILFEASGEARSRLTLSGSSFENLWTTSAQLSATDHAALDVTVRGNRLTRAGGLAIVGQLGATVTFVIESNTITSATTSPITAQLPASSSGSLSGLVSSNAIDGARCGGCGGIAVEGRGNGTVDVRIEKNTVAGVDGHGILVAAQGGGSVRAVVSENTVTEPAAAGPPLPGAIRIQAGARPADHATLCAEIDGNRISGAWDSRGPLQLVNRAGKSRLLVVGYRGAENDVAAIGAFVRQHNHGAAANGMLGAQPEDHPIAGTQSCGGTK